MSKRVEVSINNWVPFGMTREACNALVDGIPSYMESSLLDWLNSAEVLLCGGYVIPSRPEVGRRHQLINRFDRQTRRLSGLYGNDIYDATSEMEELGDICLQYVDFLIHELCELRDAPYYASMWEVKDLNKIEPCLDELERILAESGSRWKVGVRNGYEGLEERVDSTMQTMADDVMEKTDETSARLLSEAWHALFGRNPDYSKAYTTAIKAVETIAAPMVSPKNSRYTLSSLAKEMREQKWGFEIEPNPDGAVEGGIAQVMMNAMMYSHSDRHPANGVEDGVKEIVKEHAEAAVYSAVYLVQCFKSGLVLSPKGKE